MAEARRAMNDWLRESYDHAGEALFEAALQHLMNP